MSDHSITDVKAALVAVLDSNIDTLGVLGSRQLCIKALAQLGAKNIHDIAPEQYPLALAVFESVLGGGHVIH